MFMRFFTELRQAKVPVTLKEYLMLMEGLDKQVIDRSVDDFYYLSRAALVKDEKNIDKFDQVFAHVFKGLERMGEDVTADIPAEWLKKLSDQFLTDEEKAQIEAMGGFDKLMEALAERIREQKERHEKGDKAIGTGGTSPFGAYGDHPEGVRIGQDKGRRGSAVKVWDKREFKDFAGDEELGPRNIRVALRRLRRFAREGAQEELDLDGTIRATADKGYIDVQMRPERRNAVKVLLFLDVGGSMDWHVEEAEALFSAARLQFKRLEHFYFHNCLYESVWKHNRRRFEERTATADLLNAYGRDHRAIFVGDAAMSPHEILQPGGSVEHLNPEPGEAWLKRVTTTWPRSVWINPTPQANWSYSHSTRIIQTLFGERMFALTPDGIEAAMRALSH